MPEIANQPNISKEEFLQMLQRSEHVSVPQLGQPPPLPPPYRSYGTVDAATVSSQISEQMSPSLTTPSSAVSSATGTIVTIAPNGMPTPNASSGGQVFFGADFTVSSSLQNPINGIGYTSRPTSRKFVP